MNSVEAVLNAIKRHPLICVRTTLCHDCADSLFRSKVDLSFLRTNANASQHSFWKSNGSNFVGYKAIAASQHSFESS